MNEKDRQEQRLRRIEGFLYRISVFRHDESTVQQCHGNIFFIGNKIAKSFQLEAEALKRYRTAHRN